MIIEKNFDIYAVLTGDRLTTALQKLNTNKARTIFVISEEGILEGALTDGDIRRWLTSVSEINLEVPVSLVMNSNCVWASIEDEREIISSKLDNKVLALPLLDSHRRLVAVAFPRRREIKIEGRNISDEAPAFIIAEIGNNHNGDIARAYALIDAAAEAGADCAKFQMRDVTTLYRNSGDNQDASADLGAQYVLDLLSRFQLSDKDLFLAFDRCRERGLVPLCTPWDEVSLIKLEEYGLAAYKIASADFTNYDLLNVVAKTGKPMICSTGMATEKEIISGVLHLRNLGAQFILLHCNSTYPAPFKDVNLRYLHRLEKIGGVLVGYSGHERDIHVAVAAVTLGAKVVEKHFTLDKSLEGNDHKVSLLPEEFAQMVQGIRQAEEALGNADARKLSQGELMNRETLAKSLVAATDIPANTTITENMVIVKSPGQGLQPNRKSELLGRKLNHSKKMGDYFYLSDLGEGNVEARSYNFRRSWGVPVRYHDLHEILDRSNPNLLEVHLSYKDMEVDFTDYLNKTLDLDLVVHAPELFSGDHTLDLCSGDEAYRERSINELQSVIDKTRALKHFFLKAERPCIVANIGGFSDHRHLTKEVCETLYRQLESSLAQLDTNGVEIIIQTMPPFPWHFGGQQFHNLFVDPDSIARFCRRNETRVCLDLSHSKLACNFLKISFARFLQAVLPFTAHLHIADASGVDGEGLQIGEGDIDWIECWGLIEEYAPPKASFIPEIWQGHKNKGEGAWRALERLEAISAISQKQLKQET